MKFTHQTLSSTAHRFAAALKFRGLKLPWEKTQNAWAQIVVGKNYSAAISDANARGPLQAIAITDETIRSILRVRNRHIDTQTAEAIFAEAIGPDISKLSPGISRVVRFVTIGAEACVIRVEGDRSKIGIMDSKHAGYIPVSELDTVGLTEDEITWLSSSSELMATAINSMGGKNSEQSLSIFAANHRAASKKADDEFRKYFGQHGEATCITIGQEIVKEFDPLKAIEWDLDFDPIWNNVHFVIERACDGGRSCWLKPDCELAEAVIDHVAVRIRETLKWMADQAAVGEPDETPAGTIVWTAQLAMKKILGTLDM